MRGGWTVGPSGGGAPGRPAVQEEVDISFTKILHSIVAKCATDIEQLRNVDT